MYAGRLYDKYIKLHGLNIYGRRQVSLPVPKLVVFFKKTQAGFSAIYSREECPSHCFSLEYML